MTGTRVSWLSISLLAVAASTAACRNKTEKEEEIPVLPSAPPAEKKPSAEDVRKIEATPPPREEVEKFSNPTHLPPYQGPTGSVSGVVRMKGDAPPDTLSDVKDAKPECELAKPVYGKLFREGPGRSVADVLVAVTGYEGFVAPKETVVPVQGEGCTWGPRTIAMSFGQKLRISTKDRKPYVPELVGQQTLAQLFVLPDAEPIELVPRKPGRFLLLDSMRLYNRADVFVLTYPTTDVTELDGRFVISGIPVGKVKVNAFLPSANLVVEKEVEVKAETTTELEFELVYSKDAAAPTQ